MNVPREETGAGRCTGIVFAFCIFKFYTLLLVPEENFVCVSFWRDFIFLEADNSTENFIAYFCINDLNIVVHCQLYW